MKNADVEVTNHGTVWMFAPLTKTGREWVSKNVEVSGWAWMGGMFAVEHRMASSLVEGMEEAGLTLAGEMGD